MLIKGIDFPEKLLNARDSGDLVIFAGAGVSCPTPSNLPLFDRLAEEIGKFTDLERDRNEPADRYLGRLKARGVRVHERAGGFLVGDHTSPHELHHLLLQLFGSPEKVRLVTTNFDTHFSSAAKTAYKETPELFFGPALPLGDDFAGIVYLHGSAEKQVQRCVLTDEDFGRAYLTDAWVTRFLAAMFSRYVVLFVGYSHSDPVMNYLARGLPPNRRKSRFALTERNQAKISKWEHLGIEPVPFDLSSEENTHSAVTVSIREWVQELHRGFFDKAQRLRSIAEVPPPPPGEDADYIKRSLVEESTLEHFLKHALNPEWITWFDKHGYLDNLFNPSASISSRDRILAHWMATNFLVNGASSIFGVLLHKPKLNAELGFRIWRRLYRRPNHSAPPKLFYTWISFLCTQPRQLLPGDCWSQLLECCGYPNDVEAAILLFDHITRPVVILKKPWHSPFDEDNVKMDFTLNLLEDKGIWFKKACDKLIIPNIAHFAESLLPIITQNLYTADALLRLNRFGAEGHDPFAFRRQSVRRLGGDAFDGVFDILVDIAVAALDCLIAQQVDTARAYLGTWVRSSAAILRRLGIYGYARLDDFTPDAKLSWLLHQDLLFRFKPDVFDFLKLTYPVAGLDQRQKVVSTALAGLPEDLAKGLKPRMIDYEVYNLIVWLHRIAPECSLAQNTLSVLRQEHPDFLEREFSNLEHWSSSGSSEPPAEGYDIASISGAPAEDFLDKVLHWKPATFQDEWNHPRDAIPAVVAQAPEWGLDWLAALRAKEVTDVGLWERICFGWRDAALNGRQWERILHFVLEAEVPYEFLRAFAAVLEHGSRKESEPIPDGLFALSEQVAKRIWHESLAETETEPLKPPRDWLSLAINRPGGWLARFWLQRIAVARRLAGDSWTGLPPTILTHLREIIASQAGAAEHARIIFASQIHYFSDFANDFAQTDLIPLFDWSRDARTAEQCWHGFLYWGRWLPSIRDLLLPHFAGLLKQAHDTSNELQNRAMDHVAGLALFQLDDPLADGWFHSTLRSSSQASRDYLSEVIDRFLDETEEATVERIWDRWLRKFFDMRTQGVPPPPLSVKEQTQMTYWVFSLGDRIDQGIERVKKFEALNVDEGSFVHRLKKKGLAKTRPAAAAELILLYLGHKPRAFYDEDDMREIWIDLNKTLINPALLNQIHEGFAKLGFEIQE